MARNHSPSADHDREYASPHRDDFTALVVAFRVARLSLLLLLNAGLFARKNWRLRRRLVADGGAD
jgi:hypothetical protein